MTDFTISDEDIDAIIRNASTTAKKMTRFQAAMKRMREHLGLELLRERDY